MIWLLLKKQMMETGAFVFQSDQKGVRRSKAAIAGYLFLLVFVVGSMGAMVFAVSDLLCTPLVQAGMGWLFFALIGAMATVVGVFGSVFTSYSALYMARDNELLLAMPIPPSAILKARMAGIYLLAFGFEAVVLVPAMLSYWTGGYFSFSSLAAGVIILFILPFLAVVLSCILGWMIALTAPRVKYKNLIMLLLTLGVIAGYYYLYFQINRYLQMLLMHSEMIGRRFKVLVFPLYQMGLAMEGDGGALLLFAGICFVLLGIVFGILSAGFLKLLTTRRGVAKIEYREKTVKFRGCRGALFAREAARFWNCSVYLLNCGLGAVLLAAGAVIAVVKKDFLALIFTGIPVEEKTVIPMLAGAVICMIAAMDAVTASSVSLEGKNLWILQSLPLKTEDIFRSKIRLHMAVNAVPVLLCSLVVYRALGTDLLLALLLTGASVLFVGFCALSGLVINLKAPCLNWSSESAVVKRSRSSFIGIFGNMAVIFGLSGFYYITNEVVSAEVFAAGVIAILGAGAVAMTRWLRTEGGNIFRQL